MNGNPHFEGPIIHLPIISVCQKHVGQPEEKLPRIYSSYLTHILYHSPCSRGLQTLSNFSNIDFESVSKPEKQTEHRS